MGFSEVMKEVGETISMKFDLTVYISDFGFETDAQGNAKLDVGRWNSDLEMIREDIVLPIGKAEKLADACANARKWAETISRPGEIPGFYWDRQDNGTHYSKVQVSFLISKSLLESGGENSPDAEVSFRVGINPDCEVIALVDVASARKLYSLGLVG